ncbi:hypothetical protein KMC60_gp08 [Achromobacter phage vB_AxyP_19-32_Axy11]|uniref:Uncharacterized protein n=1 Tax=Achromobacter phage vB_AxyP_19-32_Axy11 TaxID=2591042 RepID=A0A514CUA0_9CAUD|nr:hypothetical protein KMC60_gp08 [Achromobacter phage vB_AxyP_19-32_Axy11]QDH84052.1 hypothetical protein Axy11_008 [Achromobacter phage vB_AxyP_19-32_Axy11]
MFDRIDITIAVLATLVALGGVLMAYWDDLMIRIFQWSFGKLTEQQAWDMHYFYEEKAHFFSHMGMLNQYEMYKSRSIAHYRYAVRLHERAEREAKHKA